MQERERLYSPARWMLTLSVAAFDSSPGLDANEELRLSSSAVSLSRRVRGGVPFGGGGGGGEGLRGRGHSSTLFCPFRRSSCVS